MIGDFLRFWWELFYWNARKSLFVLRGRRGVAPCQHPSDSGRAGETACVACHGWHKAARFRRVCPLLQRNDGEWRCSVAAAGVRPFWGRALLAWTGGALAGWILVSVAVWGVLQAVGYREMRLRDLWSLEAHARFRAAQGAFYERRAEAAFAAGDFPTGLLSLSIAYERAPRRWETGLLLGQLLARTRQFPAADRTFRSLLDGFPERADAFATVWNDTLVLRDEPVAVVSLGLERIAADEASAGPWLRSVVFALRRIRDTAVFEKQSARAETTLPGRWREVATIERDLRTGRRTVALARLDSLVATDDAALVLYRCESLIALGASDAALAQRDRHAALLGQFHAGLLGCRAAAARGQDGLADLSWENLLAGEPMPAKYDLLLAELVRHPSAGRWRALSLRWPAKNSGFERADLAAARALTAGLCGVALPESTDESRDARRLGGAIRQLAELLASAKTPRADQAGVVSGLLATVPLPREVVLAVLEARPPIHEAGN